MTLSFAPIDANAAKPLTLRLGHPMAPGNNVTVGAGAVVACGVPVYANVPEGATLSPFGVLKAGQ